MINICALCGGTGTSMKSSTTVVTILLSVICTFQTGKKITILTHDCASLHHRRAVRRPQLAPMRRN